MKKILAVVLAALMLLSMVACGNANDETTKAPETDAPVVELPYKSAEELLKQILESYNASASEETKIAVGGGNSNNFDTVSFDSPAKFVALADSDYDQVLGVPEAEVSKIDDVASMFNLMNVNIFHAYALHFANEADIAASVEAIKAQILARDWVCGAPEKLVMIRVPGNYVVVVWGAVEFGGVVNPFVDGVKAAVDGANVVVDHTFAW